ncbi:MAG: nucleotidyltransferase domain-containing protein, partial [Deltaproteobacteria bacterium]|nr:nucleotidyltransferase domain-containing protein [Deltaproteobacteria bacterium]
AQHLIAVLTEALADAPLRLAILFGSAARDALRVDSDIDIAILPIDEMTLSEELRLQGQLARATGRDVDLVRLDLADPIVRWRVACEGLVVRSDPDHEVVRFRARAALDYADLAPLFEDAMRRYRRHLVEPT